MVACPSCWIIHLVPLVVSLRYIPSFSVLRLWFCYYYTISFFLLFNVYGFSSFHIYPVTYLFLLITRGHGYSFINIPFYCFLIILCYGLLVGLFTCLTNNHAFRSFILVFLCYMIHSSMFTLHPVYESCFTSARSLFSDHTYHICIRLVVVGRSSILPTFSCTKALAFPSPFLSSVDS